MAVLLPHFALPFRLAGPSVVVVEQDSLDEIAGCVEAVVRYPLGYRVELPEFGTPDQVFKEISPQSPDEVRAAAERWEPRAGAILETHQLEEMIERILIEVRGPANA